MLVNHFIIITMWLSVPNFIIIGPFLPRDATHSAVLQRQVVVRLSVTLRYRESWSHVLEFFNNNLTVC